MTTPSIHDIVTLLGIDGKICLLAQLGDTLLVGGMSGSDIGAAVCENFGRTSRWASSGKGGVEGSGAPLQDL